MVLPAFVALIVGAPAAAETVDELPLGQTWWVAGIDFQGNTIGSGTLRSQMITKTRPWYTPWKPRPEFDPVTFTTDLERLQRFYESQGYYNAAIDYTLEVNADADLVSVHILITENTPVRVGAVDLRVEASPPAAPPTPAAATLPLKTGDVFVEEAYQLGEQTVRNFFLQRGYAHVQTTRSARVDTSANRAAVTYTARPGPVAQFGVTTVVGTRAVDPALVLREVTYKPGERFSLAKLQESRAAIRGLDLFRAVRLTPQLDTPDPRTVPIQITVDEKAPRDVRIGVGYGTDEGVRGQIQWRHRNWLGGGRQLAFQVKGSQITSEAAASFVQPHLFARANRGNVDFRLFQEDEDTFLRNATQLIPRFQHRFTPALSGFIGYRVEYDKLNNIDQATIDAIGGLKRDGVLSAPLVGLLWDTADDPLDPKRGEVLSLQVLQGGGIWGGAYNYWRSVAEAKKYVSVGWRTVLAGRLKLGLADSMGAIENLPLFERFYAGGERSVRGYARWRLGPLSSTNRPLGGRSLFEGAVEVRRPIWRDLGGAIFLDFGDVSLHAFDPPVDSLKFAPGFGVTYKTPVGPVRLDIGFPIDPPAGDQAWQLHFSIGQFF